MIGGFMDLSVLMTQGVRQLALDALSLAFWKPAVRAQLLRFLRVQQDASHRRERLGVGGVPVPPFLIASITSECNLSCRGCYARANEVFCPSMPALLPASRWGRLFDESQQLGVAFILLAGGEPLLRMDVLDEASRVRDIIFPVFTNGVLVNARTADFFSARRNLVPVLSLEGGRDATDQRRGEGIWEKAVGAMQLLKMHRILFGVSITFTRENMDEITSPAFLRDVKRLGAGIVFYVEYVPSDGQSAHLAPDDTARKVFENRLAQLRSKVRMMLLSFPGDEDFTEGCLAAGRGFVHISASGSLEPCPFSPYSDVSVADRPLHEALASPFLARIRQENALRGAHIGGCLLYERRDIVESLLPR
jgi:MoaA/NifB/PqqE/SkfB family radical SAM enzyme